MKTGLKAIKLVLVVAALCFNLGAMKKIELKGKCREFVGHDQAVTSIVACPGDKNQFITCGYYRELLLWDKRFNEPVRRFDGHKEGVKSVRFWPSNSNIFISFGDGKIFVWDKCKEDHIGEFEIREEYEGDGNWAKDVSFCKAKNSSLFVVGVYNRHDPLLLGDINKDKLIQKFKGLKLPVGCVEFLPDGSSKFISLSMFAGECVIWSTKYPIYLRKVENLSHPLSILFIPKNTNQFLIAEDEKELSLRTNDPKSENKTLETFDICPHGNFDFHMELCKGNPKYFMALSLPCSHSEEPPSLYLCNANDRNDIKNFSIPNARWETFCLSGEHLIVSSKEGDSYNLELWRKPKEIPSDPRDIKKERIDFITSSYPIFLLIFFECKKRK